MNGTKKSKLDFGGKIFGVRVEPTPTLDAQASPVQAVPNVSSPLVGGHAHVTQVGGTNPKKRSSGPAYGRMGFVQAAQPGSHAPQPDGHAPQPEGHAPTSQNAPLVSNVRKRKSGPAYGRMGFVNSQFKGHDQDKIQTLVGGHAKVGHALVGGHAKVGHTLVGGHAKVNHALVGGQAKAGHAQFGDNGLNQVGGRKYTASKLSKKGYRLSQSGNVEDIQVPGHAQNSKVSGHAQSSYDHSGTYDI